MNETQKDDLHELSLDALIEAGDVVPIPTEWLIHPSQRHGGRDHGYIALVPLTLGPDGRHLSAGDILAANEETSAIDRMVARGEIAQLPVDGGVLALVLAFWARSERLERLVVSGDAEAIRQERDRILKAISTDVLIDEARRRGWSVEAER